ncbi:unnamed protein product, partial [Symbiodinium necroappetens]
MPDSTATASDAVGLPAAPVDGGTEGNSTSAGAEDEEENQDENQWRWGGWHSGWSWGGYSSWQSRWDRWDTQSASSWSWSPPTPAKPLVEILPDFVQGWYLLSDSGLGTSDKNMIHTAIQGDYSLQRVAQELRSQWDETSLRQRDGHGRTHASYLGEDDEGESEAEYNQEGFQVDNLTEEGQALVAETEEDIQHAMAIIQQGKRTLKEARAKQQQIKLSRQYFKSGPPRGTSYGNNGSNRSGNPGWKPGQPRDDTKMQCLKCGQIGHRAANCPKKDASAGQAQLAETEENEQ